MRIWEIIGKLFCYTQPQHVTGLFLYHMKTEKNSDFGMEVKFSIKDIFSECEKIRSLPRFARIYYKNH